jgi:hypothetical protein
MAFTFDLGGRVLVTVSLLLPLCKLPMALEQVLNLNLFAQNTMASNANGMC